MHKLGKEENLEQTRNDLTIWVLDLLASVTTDQLLRTFEDFVNLH